MSKNDELLKPLQESKPGNLFGGQGEAWNKPSGGTTRRAMRAELISRLEEQRALTTGIVDKISDYGSLAKAFQAVKRNQGAAGIDGVSLGVYEQELPADIHTLQEQLQEGSYRPQAVRGIEIPKPNGGTRQLGIPTIADRVVQQSILNALQVAYEPYFSENS